MRFKATQLLVAVSVWLVACEQDTNTLRIATPTSSVDLQIARELVGMFDESDEIRLELTSDTMTESEALDVLVAGRADLALVSNTMPFRQHVTTVLPLYPTVLHVAYRDGRDASSGLSLLRGASIFAGPEGTASRSMFERIAEYFQLADTDFVYVSDLDTEADVVVLFTPISPERVAAYSDLRLFSFGQPEDVGHGSIVDAATLLNPHLRPFVIPEGTYGPTTPEPILTVAVDKMLVARDELDTSVVYDLIRALLRSRPALAAKYPGYFEHLTDEFDVTRSVFVVHPGTQAYLERDAPTVYERYSGVAEVLITVLVTMASAIVAGIRIMQRRRKNRIDEFYSSAIRIRDAVGDDASMEQRREAIAHIRKLKNAAFEQLVDEKIAADESFRIFISLSNEILSELEVKSS